MKRGKEWGKKWGVQWREEPGPQSSPGGGAAKNHHGNREGECGRLHANTNLLGLANGLKWDGTVF